MRDNPLRRCWADGTPALGAWATLPTSFSAELLGRLGLDYVCVDTQHGLIGYDESVPVIQALGLGSSTPLVRVPWNEPGIIGKSLDAGAMGVIVPMVNSAAEAEAAVAATRYPPAGRRSFGPIRPRHSEGDDYFARANLEVACIPMVETVQAIENLDAICEVPGVDAVYVGPSDLAVSLGLAPGDNEAEARFTEALTAIVDGCRRHGVVPGIHASAALLARRLEQGFRMVTITADSVALARALREDVETARGTSAGGDAHALY